MNPTLAKPRIIMAHVEGSGIAVVNVRAPTSPVVALAEPGSWVVISAAKKAGVPPLPFSLVLSVNAAVDKRKSAAVGSDLHGAQDGSNPYLQLRPYRRPLP